MLILIIIFNKTKKFKDPKKAVISISDQNFDWLQVASDEKHVAEIEKISADPKADVYNALSKIKVDFFYGGCGDNIRSPGWLRSVDEGENL